MSALTGNPFSTFLYLVKARSNKQAATHGKYRGFFFAFRGHDLSALKEVLIDDEYHFATPLLKDKKAPVIIDIGAHIGTFAIWCLSINPTSKILSIEADPETFSILNGNIQKNGAQNIQWAAVNRAAWKNRDSLSFCNQGDSMSHKVSDQGIVSVTGFPLQEVIQASGENHIDVMKIDIEGSEEAFLCENPALLNRIDCIIIELHPNLCDTARVRSTLDQYYPNIVAIQGRTSSKPLLFCTKNL